MTSRDPKRCCEAVRSAILATAWLLVSYLVSISLASIRSVIRLWQHFINTVSVLLSLDHTTVHFINFIMTNNLTVIFIFQAVQHCPIVSLQPLCNEVTSISAMMKPNTSYCVLCKSHLPHGTQPCSPILRHFSNTVGLKNKHVEFLQQVRKAKTHLKFAFVSMNLSKIHLFPQSMSWSRNLFVVPSTCGSFWHHFVHFCQNGQQIIPTTHRAVV